MSYQLLPPVLDAAFEFWCLIWSPILPPSFPAGAQCKLRGGPFRAGVPV